MNIDEIVKAIKNEDLSIEELGDLIKESFAKLYVKLREEVGMHEPHPIILSIDENSYNVDLRFIDTEHCSGESYEMVYHMN